MEPGSTIEAEDFTRLVGMIRQIAEGVVKQSHQIEELKHRVAQLEAQQRTNAVGFDCRD